MIDEKVQKGIEKTFDIYRRLGGPMGETMRRWEKYPEGDKILKNLARQKKESSTYWFEVILLISKINQWLTEITLDPMRPKERKEAIDRIGVHASKISEDMKALGLPIKSTKYFSPGELKDRYQLMAELMDLLNELNDPSAVDFRNKLKTYAEVFWMFPESEVLVTDLLVKLNDGKLLDKLANPAIVSKTGSENFPRIFLVRKLAQYFKNRYGKELHTTIANLCVLIFDDTSFDRDTVRSGLAGHKVGEDIDWLVKSPFPLG